MNFDIKITAIYYIMCSRFFQHKKCKEKNLTDGNSYVIITLAVKQKTLQGVQNMPKDLTISALLDFYGPFLSEKQRNLLHHYYNEDLSLSEIAENEAITRQGVRDLIKRGELQLKKYEDECGWCQNVLALQQALDSETSESQKIKLIKDIVNKF